MKSTRRTWRHRAEPIRKNTLPKLEQQLIQKQVISQVDAISGATSSSNNFTALVEYALDDMAEVGETEPGIIELETEE